MLPYRPSAGSSLAPSLDALAVRVLGEEVGDKVRFRIEAHQEPDGNRAYAYRARSGRLEIEATDGIAAAVGLHHYMVSAVGKRVSSDTPLPLGLGSLVDTPPLRATVRSDAVYYLNFCTFSYTTAYWDWGRWEREIDWMALHGVTMPLAVVGHEAVLYRVYRELGLDASDIREFLGGPGYLAFNFMGCLDRWAGPLPEGWLERREQLGAAIVERQLALGMTPVLPAFTGHVPATLAGDQSTRRSWWGFETHLLDPTDPRFIEISTRVTEIQREVFGTAHLYAADPFIEMEPPGDDPGTAIELARAIVGGLRAADSDAVWVMQAWTFGYLDWWTDERVAALLDAVPDDAMLVLDLWGEHSPQWRRLDGFRGKPWIWCVLHNFGGRSDLFGNLRSIERECEAALQAPDPALGVGMSMEATGQNPIIYELASDLGVSAVPDLGEWVRSFAQHRYGLTNPVAARAWTTLGDTVYAAPRDRLEPRAHQGVVTMRPSVAGLLDPGSPLEQGSWHDPAALAGAWRDLHSVAEQHPQLMETELGHDLVSVAATALMRVCDRITSVVAEGEPDSGSALIRAFDDLDLLLSLRPELRLSTWEAAAAHWGDDEKERALLLDNARRVVSVWINSDRTDLTDYSARLWSGLVSGLYRERWTAWLEELETAAHARRPPDDARLSERITEVTEAFLSNGAGRALPLPRSPLVELRHLLGEYGPILEDPDRTPQPRSVGGQRHGPTTTNQRRNTP